MAFPQARNLIHFLESHQDSKDRAAITDDQKAVSYREVSVKTDAIAEFLLAKDLRLEDPVAVYLERSVDTILAFLGILKAGAAYAPLETEAPLQRTLQVLGACQAKWIICSKGSVGLFRDNGFSNILCIEDLILLPEAPRTSALSARIAQLHSRLLAVIIFTSGSTGKPKGVMLEHEALITTVEDPKFGLGAHDVFAVTASLAFDASLYPVWASIVFGGTLAMPSYQTVIDPYLLADWVKKFQVSYTIFPTALFDQLVDIFPDFLRSMRCVMVGGEAFKLSSAKAFLSLPADNRPTVLNVYGPTECAIIATTYDVADVTGTSPTLPIGTKTYGIQTFLLNDDMDDVALGEVGELYLAGTLARGYLNNPEQTQALFIEHPKQAGVRLYKTGDRVKELSPGLFQFLGRLDFQVKIKGFRVELAEIEAVLLRFPSIKECVVQAKENPQTLQKQLLAFYTTFSHEAVKESELRLWLADHLPQYMVPDVFSFSSIFPLTTNGKVNRQVLLETYAVKAKDLSSPTTETEAQLASLWSQVLGLPLECIGVDDHFFQLGGYSLLAMKLVVLIERAFGKKISVKDLNTHIVLKDLAAHLDQTGRSQKTEVPVDLEDPDQSCRTNAVLRGLYFDEVYRGNNMGLPFHMRSQELLDPARVAFALNCLVEKHEGLRTVFGEHSGDLLQSVRAYSPFQLRTDDVRHLDASEQERVLQDARTFMDGLRFDLARGPLYGFRLIQTSAGSNLLFNIHHLVFDGWSITIFLRDFWQLMTTGLAESVTGSRFLPFVKAYSQWTTQVSYQEKIQALVQKFAPAVDFSLELPTDFPRPHLMSNTGSDFHFAIDKDLSVRIHGFARQTQSSLFATLLAAIGIWIRRSSQAEDFAIHIALAGRFQEFSQEALGNFVNTLPALLSIHDAMSVKDVLNQAKDETLALQDFQDVAFPDVAKALKLKEEKNRSLFSDIVFALEQGFHLEGRGDQGYSLEEGRLNTSSHDLMWIAYSDGTDLSFRFRYKTALFKEASIARFAASFTRLLHEMIEDGSRKICELSIIPEEEKRGLLELGEGFPEQSFDPGDLHLGARFQKTARLYPQAPALTVGSQTWTYEALDGLSNRIVHLLRSQGVETQDFVASCLERSFWSVSVMIALAKLGAVYVPLDSRNPVHRLQALLDELKPRLLLTTEALAHLFPETQMLLIDRQDLDAYAESPVLSVLSSDQLSHIQYTSGTTGKPKGIMMPHHAVVRALSDSDSLPNRPGDRVSHGSYPVFDAAIFEVWSAFIHAGHLVVVPHETVIDSRALRDFIRNEKLDQIFLPTAIFNQIASESPDVFAGVRLLMIAGDVINPMSCRRVLESGAAPQFLHNLYGPAEICFYCTAQKIDLQTLASVSIPIGRPTEGVGLYILDKHGKLLPRGVMGELYIATAHLARGYFQAPELTAQAFVTNPFRPGTLLYKSGDLARWLPDGRLEFCGRGDQQVKIRGQRIELSEIDAVLQSHPKVKEAAAVVFENEAIGKYIFAFYAGFDGELLSESQLMTYLRERLPDYMLPLALKALEALPKTNHGKVDRKKLPEPSFVQRQWELIAAPLTPEEEQIAKIWSEILSIPRDQISVDRSFFDYGGHSLMIARMLGQLKEILKKPVNFQDFLENPSIRGLLKNAEVPDRKALKGLASEVATDLLLGSELRPALRNERAAVHPQNVFLTGCTGFLGAHLLKSLKNAIPGKIFCLVRAQDLQQAEEYLKASLAKYFLADLVPEIGRSIIVILGDLEKPQLGLDAESYQQLADAVDSIYHCGARVHHLYAYKTLRKANVLSLVECIKMASFGKPKAIHFISTLSAAPVSDAQGIGVIGEAGVGDEAPLQANGYVLSKWVAERILSQAAERGFRCSVYRPGNITGDTVRGVSDPSQNHLLNLLKGCDQLSVLPRLAEIIDLTPVDICAEAVVRISLWDSEKDGPRFFNIVNPYRLTWVDYSRFMLGRIPQFSSYEEWSREHLTRVNSDNALFPLLPFYQGAPEPSSVPSVCILDQALQAMMDVGLSFPSDTRALCALYREFFLRIGFLR